jgi:hypothetical protein
MGMHDNFKKYITGAFVAGALLAPGAAWAQAEQLGNPVESAEESLDEAVEEELEADGAAEKPWSVSATLLTRGYQGLFIGLENEDDGLSADAADTPSSAFDRWLNLYVLAGGYSLDDFSFGAEIVWSHWMTPGGGYNEQYEFRFEDPSLSASWKGYEIEPIETTISASYLASLPASDVSQTANLVLGNSLSATASRKFFDAISLSYTLGGGWSAHTTEVATVSPETAQIYRETDRVGNGGLATHNGYNTQFSLTNALAASFPIWDKLSGAASYSMTKYWTYDVDNDDQFTPDGDAIQTGRMTADRTVASLGLSYPIGDYVSLGGGIRTVQAPKTDDNRSFRFPWWNFSGSARNASAFQLSVTGSY